MEASQGTLYISNYNQVFIFETEGIEYILLTLHAIDMYFVVYKYVFVAGRRLRNI